MTIIDTIRTKEKSMVNANEMTILTFQLARQIYGLPVTAVRQLIEMVTILQLPQTPPSIKGIINVRGEIVPVLDLRIHFNLAYLPYQLHTPIILVETDSNLLGFIVDEVETVIENANIDNTTYNAIFNTQTNNNLSYLACTAKVNNQIIPILNVNQILCHNEKTELAHLIADLTNHEQSNLIEQKQERVHDNAEV